MLTDLSCLDSEHNPTSPPSSKTAPPPADASQVIKSTTKRSPKSTNKKKTKKVVESEEIMEGRKMTDLTGGVFRDEISCRWIAFMRLLIEQRNLMSH